MMIARYNPGQSLLHRLSPLTKLAMLVAYSILIFAFDSLGFEAAGLAVILLLFAVTKSGQSLSALASLFVGPLVLVVFFMQVIFTPAGTPYFTIPIPYFPIPITDLGILKAFIITLRLLTIILASFLYVATTDPTELAYALMQAGVPYRYGFMVVTMLRFAPLFELEFNTVGNAQKSRGLEIDKGGVRKLFKSVRYTFVPLIVSALSRVDCLVISMEGRAFGYKRTRTFTRKIRYTPLDLALIAISVLAVALMLLDSVTGWYPLPHLGV